MKKILCALMAAIMLFTLCACGSSDKDAASSADAQKVEFTAGSWEGSVYTNEFADITYVMPAGWTHYSDEELAQQMEISLEIASDENALAEQIAKLATVYGMVSNNASSGSSVQIIFENLKISANNNMTPEEYLGIVIPMLEQMYAQYGFDCKVSDVSDITIGGQVYDYADIRVEYNGVLIKQAYVCRKIDNYICSIALTSQSEEGIKEMLNCFE